MDRGPRILPFRSDRRSASHTSLPLSSASARIRRRTDITDPTEQGKLRPVRLANRARAETAHEQRRRLPGLLLNRARLDTSERLTKLVCYSTKRSELQRCIVQSQIDGQVEVPGRLSVRRAAPPPGRARRGPSRLPGGRRHRSGYPVPHCRPAAAPMPHQQRRAPGAGP